MKKAFAALLLTALLLTATALGASTGQAPAYRAEYDGNGRVEIDFRSGATYKNLSVTVLDPDGVAQTVTILETDDDDLTFKIESIQPSTTYSFTVSGVQLPGAEPEALTGEITTPAAGETAIRSIEADDGNELEIEFAGRVDYADPTVTVTDAEGAELTCVITEKDDDSMEVRAEGLVKGEDYTVTVTGVGEAGSGISGTVTRTFTAK